PFAPFEKRSSNCTLSSSRRPGTNVVTSAAISWHESPVTKQARLNACVPMSPSDPPRSEEHTSELQSRGHLVCRLLLEKKNQDLGRLRAGGQDSGLRRPREPLGISSCESDDVASAAHFGRGGAASATGAREHYRPRARI